MRNYAGLSAQVQKSLRFRLTFTACLIFFRAKKLFTSSFSFTNVISGFNIEIKNYLMKNRKYTPALRFAILTRFYDPLVRFITREFPFKSALLAQADLRDHQTILDLACGTGTLAIVVKKRFSNSRVFAYDVDEKILLMARRKSAKARVEIDFEQGFSDNLPFADQSFDRVFSTLAFHHLTLERKIATIHEIRRVLKPDGELHLADYGLPRGKQQFVLSKFVRVFDGFETTDDNLRGRLGVLLEQHGFARVERTGYFKTIIGTIRLFKATNARELK